MTISPQPYPFRYLRLTFTVIELDVSELPKAEYPDHIGAGSPYMSTGLGLLAVFVGIERVKERIVDLIRETENNLRSLGEKLTCRRQRHEHHLINLLVYRRAIETAYFILYMKPKDFLPEQRNHMLDALRCEWRDAISFWQSAEMELEAFDRHYHRAQCLALTGASSTTKSESASPIFKAPTVIQLQSVSAAADTAIWHPSSRNENDGTTPQSSAY
jgi:hypothetical protein